MVLIFPGSLLEMLTLEFHTRLLNYPFFLSLLFTFYFSGWIISLDLALILLIISSVSAVYVKRLSGMVI